MSQLLRIDNTLQKSLQQSLQKSLPAGSSFKNGGSLNDESQANAGNRTKSHNRRNTPPWAAILAVMLSRPWVMTALIAFTYLLTHLVFLTSLPVFADESIYIRWAQLMNHDRIYTFFALNDGKPPLFIWLLAGALKSLTSIMSDPLWLSRAVSVVIGLGQVLVFDRVIRLFHPKALLLARVSMALIAIITPYWFLHHRLALMDGLLTFGLTINLAGLWQLHRSKSWQDSSPWLMLAGLGWGLALWSKTTALFWAPFFIYMAYGQPIIDWLIGNGQPWPRIAWTRRTVVFAGAGLLGLAIFALLKFHPAFGSLFGRSQDFSYTWSEWQATGPIIIWRNFQRFTPWLSTYMRPELLSLAILAPLFSRRPHLHVGLLMSSLLYLLPLLLLGKTTHARYLLPSAIGLSLSAALAVPEAWRLVQKAREQLMAVVFFLLVGFFTLASMRFMLLGWFTPNQLPLVADDREQYLTEWSSGHGIVQVKADMINYVRQHPGEQLTVVTEGSFGTLPDALLMYFDAAPEIAQLKIEGLGQHPVRHLPDWVRDEARSRRVWLVVNAHRMAIESPQLDQLQLLARYPRPYGGPDLQVWEIKPDSQP